MYVWIKTQGYFRKHLVLTRSSMWGNIGFNGYKEEDFHNTASFSEWCMCGAKTGQQRCAKRWADPCVTTSLNSVQRDDLTASLSHFDLFKESLEVDAGGSHDMHYCSKTGAITHLQIPSAVTQVQTRWANLGPQWKQQGWRLNANIRAEHASLRAHRRLSRLTAVCSVGVCSKMFG